MTNRWRLWLGASALAIASGALPAAPILSPITTGALGVDLSGNAWAQDSEEGEGAEAECTTESGEGEDGGTTECTPPTSEEGEGEGG